MQLQANFSVRMSGAVDVDIHLAVLEGFNLRWCKFRVSRYYPLIWRNLLKRHKDRAIASSGALMNVCLGALYI
jgi:hypothetical protein